MVAAAIGATAVATVGSAALSSSAAGSAASKQASAANNAANLQASMYGQGKAALEPWVQGGGAAWNTLQNMTGTNPGGNPMTASLTAPFQPTMAQLQQTPGYQFTLQQGLKATQNSKAAQGLGGSGEALAGATNYAEGLAGTTYQQQFTNYLGQNQQIFNMLAGQAQAGQNSASNLLGQGVTSAANQGGAIIGAGNAGAAGILGSAGALSGGLNNLGGLAMAYPGLTKAYGTPTPNTGAGSGGGNPGFYPGTNESIYSGNTMPN